MKAGDFQLGGRHPSMVASCSSNLSVITTGQLATSGSVLSQLKEAAKLPLGVLVSSSVTGIPHGSCPRSELPILMEARLLLFGLMEDKSHTSPNTSIPCSAGPLCQHRKMLWGVVAYAFRLSTQEAEVGRFL